MRRKYGVGDVVRVIDGPYAKILGVVYERNGDELRIMSLDDTCEYWVNIKQIRLVSRYKDVIHDTSRRETIYLGFTRRGIELSLHSHEGEVPHIHYHKPLFGFMIRPRKLRFHNFFSGGLCLYEPKYFFHWRFAPKLTPNELIDIKNYLNQYNWVSVLSLWYNLHDELLEGRKAYMPDYKSYMDVYK